MISEQPRTRIIRDLIASYVCTAQNLSSLAFDWPSSDGVHYLDGRGLQLDSLQFLELAAQVSELFGLYDSEIGDRLLVGRSLEDWSRLVGRYGCTERITFRSSGTTGIPQSHVHRYAHLQEEAAFFAALTKPERLLALVPAHHIYGCIWTAILPTIRPVEVLSGNPARKALHGDLRPSDMVVATPPLWEYVDRSGLRGLEGVIAVSSTAPLNPGIGRELMARGANLLEVYGASETAGIAYRNSPDDAFNLLPWWRDLCTSDQQVTLARQGESEVAAPLDRVDPISEREFHLAGRIDGDVQVGGHNVSPASVARTLERHPLVAAAQVRLMRPKEGSRLKALVLTEKPGDPKVKAALQHWVTEQLPAYARPRLTLQSAARADQLGKLVDWT